MDDLPAKPRQASRGPEQIVPLVIDTARRLFAERGPDAVSNREIARAAGVNQGLLHTYIGTRAELVRLVFEDAEANAVDAVGDETDPVAAMRSLRAIDDDAWARLLAWTVLSSDCEGTGQGPSPRLARLLKRADGLESAEVRAAFAANLLVTIALDLFGDWAQATVGERGDPAEFRAEIASMLDEVLGRARDGRG